MFSVLTREDIISGLRDLIAELHDRGEPAGIRLVGGSALALRYFNRGVTMDVDALRVREGRGEVVEEAVSAVAVKRGWASDWLNFGVASIDALPIMGRAVEWEVLYQASGVIVEVASAEALLAMKLRANRPGRDTGDIRMLMGVCGVKTLGAVEVLYEEFYPGDALPDRAISMVKAILAGGEPVAPPAVPRPNLSPPD